MAETRDLNRAAMALSLNAICRIADKLEAADQSMKVPELRNMGHCLRAHLEVLGWSEPIPFVPDESEALDLHTMQQP